MQTRTAAKIPVDLQLPMAENPRTAYIPVRKGICQTIGKTQAERVQSHGNDLESENSEGHAQKTPTRVLSKNRDRNRRKKPEHVQILCGLN